MIKECIWYNGEFSQYELLDFDPNGLSKKAVASAAWEMLKKRYIFGVEDKKKVMETLYLLDVSTLERVV